MAFQTAAGYGQFPNGNFSPVLYAKKAQLAFRKESICQALTNTDYMGEISSFGDSVKIMKEPEISVTPYARGTQIQAQDLTDEDFTLTIDQSNAFSFKIDDIEEAHSHINFMQLATNRAGYRLKDNYDQEVLGYMSGFKQSAKHVNADTARVAADIPGTKAIDSADADELLSSNKLSRPSFGNLTTPGSAGDSIPIAARLPGATTLPADYVSPNMIVSRMKRLLDRQNVESGSRWLVIDPVFMEILADEDSRFLNIDYGDSGALRNGLVLKNWQGFRVYVSNNMPSIGGGPETVNGAAQATDFGVILAGHDSAVATAEQINKVETFRDPDSFADVVRGMHLYGRKLLRPEAIVRAVYNLA